MKFSFDDGGLHKKLEELSKAAEELNGKQDVPLSELFPAEFISTNTSLASIDELFEIGGWDMSVEDALSAIPDTEIDIIVQRHTSFATWHDMLQAAIGQHAAKKLGF